MVPPPQRDPVSKKGFLIGENHMTELADIERPRPQGLNRIIIVDVLQELGLDVELSSWVAYDDGQVLDELVTYAHCLNMGWEDLFEACGIGLLEKGDIREV
jgi:hypothetical protein